MTARVVPFPRSRDRGFVTRHAAIMASLSTSAKSEAHLQRQLKIQAEAMQRRGIAPETIAAELAVIEGSIRAAVWGLLMAPGGAA